LNGEEERGMGDGESLSLKEKKSYNMILAKCYNSKK
jgi:hypothetical protein